MAFLLLSWVERNPPEFIVNFKTQIFPYDSIIYLFIFI